MTVVDHDWMIEVFKDRLSVTCDSTTHHSRRGKRRRTSGDLAGILAIKDNSLLSSPLDPDIGPIHKVTLGIVTIQLPRSLIIALISGGHK